MRDPKARQRKTIGFDISRGMWSGGDAARIPAENARRIRNMVREDSVWDNRPPLTYDGLTGIRGLGIWYDETNGVSRLVAAQYDPATGITLNVKGTSGETYSVSGSAANGQGFDDFTNYNGRMYASVIFTSGTNIQPLFLDNTTNHVFTDSYGPRYSTLSVLSAKSITAYKERLFFGGLVLNFENQLLSNTSYPYDPSSWSLNTATASSVVANSATTYSLTPTNTTTAKASLTLSSTAFNGYHVTWRGELRNTSSTYSVPMTAQIQYVSDWTLGTGYSVGDLITAVATPNSRIFKCTTAGTSGGAEPAWSTNIGTTTADNTVTWTSISTDVIGSSEFYLPTSSAIGVGEWFPFGVKATMPATSTAATVRLVLKFGTTGTPTITLTTVDFGYKDGLADGTINKENHGHQLTLTDFDFPFANIEAFASVAIKQKDYLYWTDPLSNSISSSNYYRVQSPAGPITAVREFDGKLLVFKRSAIWVFSITEDPDVPILPEGNARIGIGLLNPKALDTGPDGNLYGVGENFVWRMSPGGEPVDICTDAVRSEMFNKSSSSWVESQSFPANRALLTVDHKHKQVLVYTQKGRIHCYNIDDNAWSVLDAGGDTSVAPVGYQICDMLYNPGTGHVYLAFTTSATGTAGLARLDDTVSPAYDQISSSGTLTVHSEIWPRPVELSTPRYEMRVDDVRIHHAVTASQTDQTTTVGISFDQGQTFTRTNTVTLAPLSTGEYRPMTIPVYQGWETLQLRILHSGKGGRTSFNVSSIEADVQLARGLFPKDKATPVSSNLTP